MEVSVWGEICQLFSTTLRQHKKKKNRRRGIGLPALETVRDTVDMDVLVSQPSPWRIS